MKHFALIPFALLLACGEVAPGPDYLPDGAAPLFQLRSVDGAPAAAGMSLEFSTEGQVSGNGPCNSFAGTQAGVYPAFSAPRLNVTERACDRLDVEADYLAALTGMTQAALTTEGDLILTGGGRQMTFAPAPVAAIIGEPLPAEAQQP